MPDLKFIMISKKELTKLKKERDAYRELACDAISVCDDLLRGNKADWIDVWFDDAREKLKKLEGGK